MNFKLIKKQIICIILIIIFVMPIMSTSLYSNIKATNVAIQNNTIIFQGNTSDELQEVIDNASSGDTIVLTNDVMYTATTSTINTIYNVEITIQSDEGNNWKLVQTNPEVRHFMIQGGLTLQNITLDGNDIGGGIDASGAYLTINTGTIIQNCYARSSGSAIVITSSTVTMDGGLITNNTAGWGGGVAVYGIFHMYGGTISNNTATMQGGGVYANNSTLYIYGGEIIDNTAVSQSGGGIYVDPSGMNISPIISNTTISGNKALNENGGGIYSAGINLTLSNSIVSNNHAINGGGLYFIHENIISNSTIDNNVADNNGGGLFISHDTDTDPGICTMDGSTISNNKSDSGNGGGIYMITEAILRAGPNNTFTANNALEGNGGGIYTEDVTYSNLELDNTTMFSSNRAVAAYTPPENPRELYPSVRFASTSITTHPLNNYDINYIGDILQFNITYDANGGSGNYVGPWITPSDSTIVLSLEETEISRTGYIFAGWNTSQYGTGNLYNSGDSIILNDNIILYAQWKADKNPNNSILMFLFIILFTLLVMGIIYFRHMKKCKMCKCKKCK